MARTSSRIEVVDDLGNVASSNILAGYQPANKEDVPDGVSYYGFLDTDGNWYIERVTGSDIDFARGSSGYSANWSNRASLVYGKFDTVF